MKTITIEIKGISPLLMNKFPLINIDGLAKKSPEEQAEIAAYRSPSGELAIPGINIQRALVSAATYSKGKGRASLQKEVAGSLLVNESLAELGKKNFAVDSRPVVIAATKGRIVRHRPRIDDWQCRFSICFDETLMTEAQVRKIVDDCGQRVGLLDFRPEKKGPFGRFMITNWKAKD